MKYAEAPDSYDELEWPFVFLAGGITDCPDWQRDLRDLLETVPRGTLLNPRRADFPGVDLSRPGGDLAVVREQVAWEFRALNRCQVFSMWFCAGPSVQPICMYELGRMLSRWELSHLDRVCVGVEPGYLRELDVRIQLALVDDSIPISTSLDEHADRIRSAVQTLYQWRP